MNCLEFRHLKLTDPYTADSDADIHRNECTRCRAFENEIQEMDATLKDALTVDVPEGLAARILLNQALQPQQRRPTPWHWLGMAASFFIVAVGILALQFRGENTVADRLISHIEHEHGAQDRNLKTDHVQQVMYSVQAEASALPGEILYASNCIIDGELVAHLLVKNDNLEYTVILIPRSLVDESSTIATSKWRGIVTHHPVGSLAVIANSGYTTRQIEGAVQEYSQAIRRRTI